MRISKSVKLMVSLFMIFNIVSIASVSAAQVQGVTVKVNNKTVTFPDAKPYTEDDRVMIPIRFVSEALGANVAYSKERVVTVQQGEKKISMKVNSTSVVVDTVIKKLDVPARLQQSRVFVPLRFVSEALGAQVGWDQKQRIVSITTETKTPVDNVSQQPGKDFVWNQENKDLGKVLFVDNITLTNGTVTFTLPKDVKGTYYNPGGGSVLTSGNKYTFNVGQGKGFVSFTMVDPTNGFWENFSIIFDVQDSNLERNFSEYTKDAVVKHGDNESLLSEVIKAAQSLK
ncbi:copper amine oxidase N-terminal domain-containing protein [Paenibacillus sp. LMG 31459]|uniref:Copper amine oxidase N-terminal domain-containing protein n=1 Tax=Paenibacillus phytohabitans TaxID=2654978 RepID=A0ABX1YM96_9BACL|nr:copper amine oxidase N-terminal domain-containing protein [Paenibacillus phytohabitans]NOU80779.1 copper amine oxidase N-terminal domain-containing protein [Paenibacillus phytohabitans]